MLNPAYRSVSLRAVGTPPGHHDVVGLALDVEGGVAHEAMRLRLTLDQAKSIAMELLEAVAIQRYRDGLCQFQSPISSGNPSSDGSPQEGQSVCPPAAPADAPPERAA